MMSAGVGYCTLSLTRVLHWNSAKALKVFRRLFTSEDFPAKKTDTATEELRMTELFEKKYGDEWRQES